MATTINSTSLDINSIKNNLKDSLRNSGEFEDFDFEASGISSILDVLAYNTHYNGLTANFALNESFLSTAQLRSSVLSLAEGIGYVADSRTASQATIKLSLVVGGSGVIAPPSIQINENFKFNTTVDDESYIFQTREDISAVNNNGSFIFSDISGDTNIKIIEGLQRTKTFIALKASNNPIYVIPDKNMDMSTAIVRVYDSATSSTFTTYSNIVNAQTINENSTLYILREAPNGNFDLSFGNGSTLGKAPNVGAKIEVEYISTSGSAGNTANVFEASQQVFINNVGYTLSVTTNSAAVGGSSKEGIESIRKNAPFQYASQNRMVTAADYSALILKNFSTFISDIQSFGGEDALEPEFGVVFVSILFNDDVVESGQVASVKEEILDLSEQLSVASFDVKFEDPIKTFIEVTTFFQFNDNLTTLSRNTIEGEVNSVIDNYFTNNTGKFGQSFRRSNLLSLVDSTSAAVLSSRQEIKMQRRFTPTLTAIQNHTLRYAAPIAAADDEFYRITSDTFIFRGNVCVIRNRLKSNILEIFNTNSGTVIIDNIGDYSNDVVRLVGLQVDSLTSGDSFLKLSAVPANQSAISPLRQDVLVLDSSKTFTKVVDVLDGVNT
jgi:hypothetical protein